MGNLVDDARGFEVVSDQFALFKLERRIARRNVNFLDVRVGSHLCDTRVRQGRGKGRGKRTKEWKRGKSVTLDEGKEF